jgi:hypothetical protein
MIMKQVIFILMVMLTGTLTHGQEVLPPAVDQAFKTRFSKAKDVSWFREYACYVFEFEIPPELYSAAFDEKGNWIETARIINDMDVPSPVTSLVKKQYPKMIVSYTEAVETSTSEKFFRVHGCSDGAEHTINITKEGSILSSRDKEFTVKSTE